MKLIVALFWSVVLGEVAGYIMTALAGVPDNATWTLGVSLVFGIFVYIVSIVAVGKDTKEN
ncbi:DUF2929 family protein [Lactococcus nasutitermitis]|uniref:DUF2929 family protein n=1 Tax=Lactococcus nasutitermitis TaxID=1652957 RepID=A0ABV9JF75_9LACT|nr:DUF2929 family protein [Lactococcus nasutitermitis]